MISYRKSSMENRIEGEGVTIVWTGQVYVNFSRRTGKCLPSVVSSRIIYIPNLLCHCSASFQAPPPLPLPFHLREGEAHIGGKDRLNMMNVRLDSQIED